MPPSTPAVREQQADADFRLRPNQPQRIDIESETLATWFLRLNGFFTMPNFIVHPEDAAAGQQTDVDVLAVRFPHRIENRNRPMADFESFATEHRRVQLVLAEAKRGKCRVNGPWKHSDRQNMEKVLGAAGVIPIDMLADAARQLYGVGQWQSDGLVVRIVCFGERMNAGLCRELPGVEQLLWKRDVLSFIHNRFWEYRTEKQQHDQWPEPIKALFRVVLETQGDVQSFLRRVEVT